MVGSIKQPMIFAIFEGMNFINQLVLTMQNTSGVKNANPKLMNQGVLESRVLKLNAWIEIPVSP